MFDLSPSVASLLVLTLKLVPAVISQCRYGASVFIFPCQRKGGGDQESPFLHRTFFFFLNHKTEKCTESVRLLLTSTRWCFDQVKCVPSLHSQQALPPATFTFSALRARFNQPVLFTDLPDVHSDFHFRFYSLLSRKEDIISSLLSTHTVGVTMGTWEPLCSQQRPDLLHCAERQQLSLPLAGKQAH